MPLRDLALIVFVFGSIPFIVKRPYWGLLMWVWLSIMNPHRQTFGIAYEMPFAQIVAIVTLLATFFQHRQRYRFPFNGVTVALIVFLLWTCVSPLASFHPEGEYAPWIRVVKIQVMVLLAFLLVGTRAELHGLAAVLVLSIAYYGVKGGVFTIATGGSFRVWGPEGSFVGDNNSIALAIVMVVPLLRYLQLNSARRIVKLGCLVAMGLCMVSAVGSYSRGALVALVAMSVFLWLKGDNKLLIGIVLLIAVPLGLSFMPEHWSARMSTIQSYGEDNSAMGRINAWWMAFNLANSRFPIGGGFNIYQPDVFARFAPVAEDIHAAHSIYFQVLGEHGYIGLLLFLAVFIGAWRCGSWVLRNTRKRPELAWARHMASMAQVSLMGYFVGGAFLSLSYYDYPYYVVVLLVVLREVVRAAIATPARPARPAVAASPAVAPRAAASTPAGFTFQPATPPRR